MLSKIRPAEQKKAERTAKVVDEIATSVLTAKAKLAKFAFNPGRQVPAFFSYDPFILF